jgi:proline iminopeptidase
MSGCKDSIPKAEEGYLDVPGGKVWYRIVGVDHPKTPLLVVHGGPGAAHGYLKPLEQLAQDRPVVFYDQLGCGRSERPSDKSLWTLERFVEELAQVRAQLGLESVHILGQSWGAAIAVDYVLEKTSTGIESLVLSGPLLSASRWVADQRKYIAQLSEDSRKAIINSEQDGSFDSPEYQEALMEFYRRHVCRLEEWPDYLTQAFADLNMEQYLHMWGPSEFTVTGSLKSYERLDRLEEINIPTLFTCGEYDEASPDTCRLYQRHLPGSKLHIFEDASHEHHIENKEGYLQVVGAFLEQVEPDHLIQ